MAAWYDPINYWAVRFISTASVGCYRGDIVDEKRRIYERIVQASLLIEEAKTQAMRAAHAAAKFRDCAMSPQRLARTIDEIQIALEKSSQCTNEASTLIEAA